MYVIIKLLCAAKLYYFLMPFVVCVFFGIPKFIVSKFRMLFKFFHFFCLSFANVNTSIHGLYQFIFAIYKTITYKICWYNSVCQKYCFFRPSLFAQATED